jgi:predicted transcriptional regulator
MINNPDIQIMNQIRLLPALITFSEVALQGSFTKAAKLLGLSKSGVSQQITKLEQELFNCLNVIHADYRLQQQDKNY